MTNKDWIQRQIEESSFKAFQWKLTYITSDLNSNLSNKINSFEINKTVALIKLLVWVYENLFNEKGSFSLPILKIIPFIKSVKRFFEDINTIENG
jgi:hypothetical protein